MSFRRAERARVEEQLMDSAAHRQLFEELKSLRVGLQALPRKSLDADFASRVLKRAEQQLLDEPVEPSRAADQSTNQPQVVAAGQRAGPSHWRGLVWSVATLAAAVMLIVFSPMFTRKPLKDVALQTDEEKSVAENQQPESNGRDLGTTGGGKQDSSVAQPQIAAVRNSLDANRSEAGEEHVAPLAKRKSEGNFDAPLQGLAVEGQSVAADSAPGAECAVA